MSAEQWRSIVSKYFRPEDVDKALYVIDHESGGRADAVGDNGASHGLFQLNDHGLGSGMSVDDRLDPEKNIAAAAKAVYGGSGWKPWGEGNTFHGATFGSLGNNPYPGDGGTTGSTGGGGGGSTTTPANPLLSGLQTRIKTYEDKLDALQSGEPTTNENGEHDDWADQVKIYGGLLNTAYQRYGQLDNGPAKDPDHITPQAAFNNQVEEDKLKQDQAQQEIDRFFKGQGESRSRAQLGLQGKEDLIKYGTSGGKTKFSYADLGAGFAKAAGLMGLGPNDTAIGYSGTTEIDPMGDMARWDADQGYSGGAPAAAGNFSSPGYIPGNAGADLGGGLDSGGLGSAVGGSIGDTFRGIGDGLQGGLGRRTGNAIRDRLSSLGAGLGGNNVAPPSARDDWMRPPPAIAGPREPGSAPLGMPFGPQAPPWQPPAWLRGAGRFGQ